MRLRILLCPAFAALIVTTSWATIIHVPGQYATIQAGIDASIDGDTVLVAPGTYHERINFNGHNSVVASLFFTMGNMAYIDSTIIDGDFAGIVVVFNHQESNEASIIGFTIQNGHARCPNAGGGIFCSGASPMISYNKIINNFSECVETVGNSGGGVGIQGPSDAIISNNLIAFNEVKHNWEDNDSRGGGIYCWGSGNIIFRNNTIIANAADIAGGIFIGGGNQVITNCIIWGNHSSLPQELYVYSGGPIVSYSNIREGWVGEGNIDQDPLFIDASKGNFNYCSQSPCLDSGDSLIHDPDGTRSDIGIFFSDHPQCLMGRKWFVETTGSDSAGNGSMENPFGTIQHAIDIATHADTVIIQPGTYLENISLFFKNITLASNFVYSGNFSDIESTIIDGNQSSSVYSVINNGLGSNIIGLTLSNGEADRGGGVYADNAILNLSYNIIRDNLSTGSYFMVGTGGGIYSRFSTIRITNNIISSNVAHYGDGSAIVFIRSNSETVNNVIVNNFGYSAVQCFGLDIVLSSNIIWGNRAPQIWYYNISPVVRNCDVQGGWPGEGNINIDPLFRDTTNGDFHLMSTACGDSIDSPCIDAGDPTILDSLLDCSWGLGTTRSDMGAYGGGDSIEVGIEDWISLLPKHLSLSQNYPNPFNPTTTIAYELPHACRVRLEVFDLLGRRVAMLEDGEKPAGKHQAVWNAGEVSSGIYFYRLMAGDKTEIKKMTLLK